jgi:hypothetical protein
MTTPTQPGWYDDPDNSNAQRYWDGQDWTPHRQRKPAGQPAPPPTQAQAPVTPTAPSPPPPPNLPPPPPAADPLPPPPAEAQPPHAPRGKFRVNKVALVLTGLALVLAIAAVVAGRVALGSFVWGIVLVAAIALIAAFFTLRSNRPVARKAMAVTAIAVVVAAAIPASLKVVYPVYNHFLPQKSAQASRGGTAGPGSVPDDSGPGAPSSGSGPGAPSSGSTGGAKSGIVAVSTSTSSLDFGYFDPSTGKYTHVSSFTAGGSATSDVLQISPDLSRYATSKTDNSGGGSYQAPERVGWVDSRGTFTAVSPAPPPATDFQQSQPPRYGSPMFDGAGNFYYSSMQDGKNHLYKVPAGSTSNPEEVTPTPKDVVNAYRNFDGTLRFGCPNLPGKWLGPDSRMFVSDMGDPTTSNRDNAVVKAPLTTTGDGCPWVNQIDRQGLTKIFDLGIQPVEQPVANPDHTKIAFYNSNTPGGLYIVTIGGDSKPTRIASKEQLTQFGNLKLIGWS